MKPNPTHRSTLESVGVTFQRFRAGPSSLRWRAKLSKKVLCEEDKLAACIVSAWKLFKGEENV